jgi:Tfp pilus assembly protein PilV
MPRSDRADGFTLIEVVGALVIFSAGVLGLMNVGSSLTTQLRYSGARSEIVVMANERLDSIESMPFDSIVAGTTQKSMTIQGWAYECTVTVTDLTPVLTRVDVTIERLDGLGPSHDVTSYTSAVW